MTTTQRDQQSYVLKKAESSLKRKLSYDQKKRETVEQPGKIKKSKENYVCLECLESLLQRKLDEKNACVCRINTSTINQHKRRWHTTVKSEACTVVPSRAPDVRQLYTKYGKAKKAHVTNPRDKSRVQAAKFPTNSCCPAGQKNIAFFLHLKNRYRINSTN